MITALLPTDSPAALAAAVEQAAALLSQGEAIGLPTETVYGLAADASRQDAVLRIFEAKERPLFDPLIVHLPCLDWLPRVAELPCPGDPAREILDRLIALYWPGPLTILVPRRAATVPDLVTAGSPLVAVRQSAHPVFRAVIERFGRPLAAPSANRFGRISPTEGSHVLAELDGRIPLVVDAGPSPHGLESTIVSIEAAGRLVVLRHGPVTAEMLAEIAPVTSAPRTGGRTGGAAAGFDAPGQLPGHYAPRTPLVVADLDTFFAHAASAPDAQRIGLLRFTRRADGAPPLPGVQVEEALSEAGDLREAASRLFAALRRLDEAGVNRIVAEPVPETGLGTGIMERLRRAAAGSGP